MDERSNLRHCLQPNHGKTWIPNSWQQSQVVSQRVCPLTVGDVEEDAAGLKQSHTAKVKERRKTAVFQGRQGAECEV